MSVYMVLLDLPSLPTCARPEAYQHTPLQNEATPVIAQLPVLLITAATTKHVGLERRYHRYSDASCVCWVKLISTEQHRATANARSLRIRPLLAPSHSFHTRSLLCVYRPPSPYSQQSRLLWLRAPPAQALAREVSQCLVPPVSPHRIAPYFPYRLTLQTFHPLFFIPSKALRVGTVPLCPATGSLRLLHLLVLPPRVKRDPLVFPSSPPFPALRILRNVLDLLGPRLSRATLVLAKTRAVVVVPLHPPGSRRRSAWDLLGPRLSRATWVLAKMQAVAVVPPHLPSSRGRSAWDLLALLLLRVIWVSARARAARLLSPPKKRVARHLLR
ncbi:hypothetical protein F5141DRAFT_1293940, partial [Pisolithus sp. B1]